MKVKELIAGDQTIASNRKSVQNLYVLWEYFQRENRAKKPGKEGCLNYHLQFLSVCLSLLVLC